MENFLLYEQVDDVLLLGEGEGVENGHENNHEEVERRLLLCHFTIYLISNHSTTLVFHSIC